MKLLHSKEAWFTDKRGADQIVLVLLGLLGLLLGLGRVPRLLLCLRWVVLLGLLWIAWLLLGLRWIAWLLLCLRWITRLLRLRWVARLLLCLRWVTRMLHLRWIARMLCLGWVPWLLRVRWVLARLLRWVLAYASSTASHSLRDHQYSRMRAASIAQHTVDDIDTASIVHTM